MEHFGQPEPQKPRGSTREKDVNVVEDNERVD